MADRIVVRKAKDGWRWTRYSENNRVVGASTEAYHHKSGAIDNVASTQLPPFNLTTEDLSVTIDPDAPARAEVETEAPVEETDALEEVGNNID